MSNRKSIVIAYIDFQRPFDSTSHRKLLHKLCAYGIHGNLFFWISSFLSGRLQCVRVGSYLSSYCPGTSGVPQGSVIGPLLFNLFINDITDNLDSTTTSKIFADDIKIYTEFSTTISPGNLQIHLALILSWSTLWQLPISHTKCIYSHLVAIILFNLSILLMLLYPPQTASLILVLLLTRTLNLLNTLIS